MLFKNFFNTKEYFVEILKEKNLIPDFETEPILIEDFWHELIFVYKELNIIKPSDFMLDFETQFRRYYPQLVLLEQVRKNPIQSLDDILTKSTTARGSKENNSTYQDGKLNVNPVDKDGNVVGFDFNKSDGQTSETTIYAQVNKSNMRNAAIRKELRNGIRELAENFDILFQISRKVININSNETLVGNALKKVSFEPVSGDMLLREFINGEETKTALKIAYGSRGTITKSLLQPHKSKWGNFVWTGTKWFNKKENISLTFTDFLNIWEHDQHNELHVFDNIQVKLSPLETIMESIKEYIGINDITPVEEVFNENLIFLEDADSVIEFEEGDLDKSLSELNIKYISLEIDRYDYNLKIVK